MTASVELSSGKTAKDENFPVGSWLLPAALRPHVAIFYAFARAADDIADSPILAPEEKIARLDAFEAVLTGADPVGHASPKSRRMRASLAETGVTPRHCQDLLAAFRQDATKLRYAGWTELRGYCTLSASPVGRYLLDLHGESRLGYPASDALCDALQVLNHLQDCQDDYRALDRVYLPLDWLEQQGGTVADLDKPRATPAVRRAIDRTLDAVEELLVLARELPGRLRSRHLAMESAVIVRLAERLTVLLRRGDPLAGRVALSRLDFMTAGMRGIGQGWFNRPPAPSRSEAGHDAA